MANQKCNNYPDCDEILKTELTRARAVQVWDPNINSLLKFSIGALSTC